MIVTRNYTHQHNIIGWEANIGEYPLEETGLGWTPSEKVRLFPNQTAIRFDYPVHEVLGPSLSRNGIAVKTCPCPVHHFGKMDLKLDRRKDEYYYQIGKRKLSETSDDPAALRELAIQAAKLEKHEDALQLWKRFMVLNPEDARGYVNMASNYGKLRQFDKARKAARKAVQLAPHLKEAHLNLGLSQFHLGHLAEAEHIFSALVQKHANYYSAVFLHGAAQLGQGKIAEGAQTLRSLKNRAIVWDHLSHAIQELVDILMASGRHDIARHLITGSEKLDRTNENLLAYRRQLQMEAA
jgi:tetratricopeptide (TPR) repeat protein